MPDLLVRGGMLVSAQGLKQTDIAIENGRIVELSDESSLSAKEELDASHFHVFAGLIDTHVHFNEPGREHWEGIASGSAALAAGGGTLFVDMPLNSDPPLLSAKDFLAKQAAAEVTSLTDFAFWGGLTPDNLDTLAELAELGVVGFKAFMSNSGIAEFRAADDLTLYKGMTQAAALGLPVAVHAESEALCSQLSHEAVQQGKTSIRDYLDSRPIIAELEAINRALFFAEETNCDLHVVHVSSARGIALIAAAKQRGVKVSCETCAHYLALNEEDVLALGAVAKCAPPLRTEQERQALWQAVLQNHVDMIASDHSPSDPNLKHNTDFFKVWGGISGVQSTLNVLLNGANEQDLALETISQLTAQNPAERFGLRNKGKLELGFDADLCLLDLGANFELKKDDLFYKHKQSPYIGKRFSGQVKQTLSRGKTIFKNGLPVTSQTSGRLVTPKR